MKFSISTLLHFLIQFVHQKKSCPQSWRGNPLTKLLQHFWAKGQLEVREPNRKKFWILFIVKCCVNCVNNMQGENNPPISASCIPDNILDTSSLETPAVSHQIIKMCLFLARTPFPFTLQGQFSEFTPLFGPQSKFYKFGNLTLNNFF